MQQSDFVHRSKCGQEVRQQTAELSVGHPVRLAADARFQGLAGNEFHDGIGGVACLETRDNADNPWVASLSRQPEQRTGFIEEAPPAVSEDTLVGRRGGDDVGALAHPKLLGEILFDGKVLPQKVGRLIGDAEAAATQHPLQAIPVQIGAKRQSVPILGYRGHSRDLSFAIDKMAGATVERDLTP